MLTLRCSPSLPVALLPTTGAVHKELHAADADRRANSSLMSEWDFPVLAVLKKNRTLSLCVDYRKLNGVFQPMLTVCHA